MKLLLVGWDAADWKVIDPLLAAGEMPHLAGVISGGVRANLGTIFPALSPMVWTSIATGKRPHKHGIHGFTEPTPDGLAVRPITILGRKTKAFWNILHQQGKRSIVTGWWPSQPAEPIRGAMVANSFPFPHGAKANAGLPAGAISPAALTESLAELRVHATELSPEIIRMFVPEAAKIDQKKDRSLHDLAGIIAETMSMHNVATELMETQPWDLAAIYYTGIDHFSHRFMRYHARKRIGKEETDPAIFGGVVANAYRYHDVMLGRLLQLAGPDAAVLILSDHGFHSDQLLPDYIPAEAAGPAVEHRDFGIFCLRAPGVPAGGRIYGASVLDIAPTILHLFGLPAGKDMDGKVLINAFEDATLPPAVPSWDDIPGEDGRHPPSMQYDAGSSVESLKQLVELGYIAPLEEDASKTVEKCMAENKYNLARALLHAGLPADAALHFRELISGDPEQGRFHEHLVNCHMVMEDYPGALKALQAFDRAAVECAPRAQEELTRRREEKPDTDVTRDEEDKNRKESHERRELIEKASSFGTLRLLLHCRLAVAQARTPARKQAAREMLEQLAKATRGNGLALFLAEGFAIAGDDERALTYTRRARRADPEDWQALALEARVHHRGKRWDKAVDAAVESLALIYAQPHLHFVLGVSLAQLEMYEQAEQELRVAISQAPGLVGAVEALARVIRHDRARIGEAAVLMAHAKKAREKTAKRRLRQTAKASEPLPEPVPEAPGLVRWQGAPPEDRTRTITVVTGLPRSGTSMMMQMLAAGGVRPFTDEKRAADSDNPRGYFEHERATRVHQDVTWIPETRGKVVKIVAQLVPFLPQGEDYRLVFMHRNLKEVVASQKAMLKRLGRKGGRIGDAALMRSYTAQLVRVQTWLKIHPEVQVLAVDYGDAVKNPGAVADRLAAFLGAPFDAKAAAGTVDAALRRQSAG